MLRQWLTRIIIFQLIQLANVVMQTQSVEYSSLSVCPLDCPDTCSLQVTVDNDQLVEVRGSRANPYTDNKICTKVAHNYPEFVHGRQRLDSPLKRTASRGTGEFQRISWDEALDLIHAGFSKAIDQYGPQSVVPLNYAGPHGELAHGSMDRRFFHKLGASLLDRGPLCGAVRGTAYTSLFGTAPGMPPEQAVHSDLIVIWGNNVTVSNLHLARILKIARERGAKVVTIDPKRVRIAEQSHLHLQIRPGTDVILAMAAAAELERREALDSEFIETWTLGFDRYMDEARNFTPTDVESECGLSSQQFDQFVNLYVGARNVAVSVGNGIERGRSGGSGLRAAMSLQSLTGNHGRLGSGVLAKPGFAAPLTRDRLQRPDLVPDGTRTLNIVDMADNLLDSTLEPPIMATMIYNHNPVSTHPDQTNLIKALQRDNLFIAGSDIVMTDSMAYADVIVPAASHFEYPDIYGAYGQNYIQRAEPVIPCVGEAVSNTELFRRLAARFGFDDPIFLESDEQLMDSAMDGNDPRLQGIRPSELPLDRALEMKSISGEDAILCKTVVPTTPSGKIELFSEDLQDRFECGVPQYRSLNKTLPFTLISPSSSKRTNATFGGCAESDGYEMIEMNPEDAEKRGLSNDDIVSVYNDSGAVTLRLSVTDATLPGVLYSPKGAWRRTSDTGMTVNSLIPADIRADIMRGACYNETFVKVSRSQ